MSSSISPGRVNELVRHLEEPRVQVVCRRALFQGVGEGVADLVEILIPDELVILQKACSLPVRLEQFVTDFRRLVVNRRIETPRYQTVTIR
jgi:hypothetical protein